MANHKQLLKSLIILSLMLGIYWLSDFLWVSLRRNSSESLPFWLFKSSFVVEIKKESYVSIKHPQSKVNLAKQIVGLPGDEIKIEEGHVFVSGRNCGIILEKGRSGKPLTPISEGKIPEGYFFTHATHPESFDSRYAEFGLISKDQIEEVLWPLF